MTSTTVVEMLSYLLVCCLLAQMPFSFAAKIDNKVLEEPEVECAAKSIKIAFKTQSQFEGHVYVKGFYDNKDCRRDATLENNVDLEIPFQSCDVRRRRSSNPRGLFMSVTVVITFHPMFITMVDRAYNVQCFYMETDKEVSAEIGVSMNGRQYQQVLVMLGGTEDDLQVLKKSITKNQFTGQLTDLNKNGPNNINQLTTEVITVNVPMPRCTYQVLENDGDGAPVRYATVGQMVYHKWTCTNEDDENVNLAEGVFCMTVHSCFVDNGQGKKALLLDENGCARDQYLLNNLDYQDDLTGGQTSMVFKFADQPSLFFQCQIRLSLKEGDKCERSSDDCADPKRIKKRSADKNEENKDDDNNFDVYTEPITIFDIDTPLDETAAKRSEIESAAAKAAQLNRRLAALRPRVVTTSGGQLPTDALCLSPLTFGALMAVLASVLLACLAVVAVLAARHSRFSNPQFEQTKCVE